MKCDDPDPEYIMELMDPTTLLKDIGKIYDELNLGETRY